MKIHQEELSDNIRYIENHKNKKLEENEPVFTSIFKQLQRFKTITPDTRILEVGIGSGWLQIMCKKKGLSCHGIEISPQMIEFAQDYGRKFGVEPDIKLGNIENAEIDIAGYDIVIATSTFEHVEKWKIGLKRIFDALKPGGVFYFYSTSKFSFKSGEYNFPLYNWLPNRLRYKLRMIRQGEDIMKLGIDFNQFTYFNLRSFFKKLGYSTILDRVEILDPNNLDNPRPWKNKVLRMLKQIKILKQLALLFDDGTFFICIK